MAYCDLQPYVSSQLMNQGTREARVHVHEGTNVTC